jgi:hypothetical protein
VILQPSGASGVVSRPNVCDGTEYQGLKLIIKEINRSNHQALGIQHDQYLRFPQYLNISNVALPFPIVFDGLLGPSKF